MLGGQDDLEVVGEAGDGREALRKVDELRPDVVLMDIRMPRMNGLEADPGAARRPDPPHVIVLTTFDADEHVVEALAAGADGFLLKDTPPPQILDAIRNGRRRRPDALPVGDPHPDRPDPRRHRRRPGRDGRGCGSTCSPSASTTSRSRSAAD